MENIITAQLFWPDNVTVRHLQSLQWKYYRDKCQLLFQRVCLSSFLNSSLHSSRRSFSLTIFMIFSRFKQCSKCHHIVIHLRDIQKKFGISEDKPSVWLKKKKKTLTPCEQITSLTEKDFYCVFGSRHFGRVIWVSRDSTMLTVTCRRNQTPVQSQWRHNKNNYFNISSDYVSGVLLPSPGHNIDSNASWYT